MASVCIFGGCESALDTLLHLVPDQKQPIGIDLLRKWMHGCYFAMAWQQMEIQRSLQLTDEFVEADGSKTLTTKSSSKVWHLKRRKRILKPDHVAALEAARQKCKVGPFARRVANQTVARGKRKLVVHHGRMLWVVGRFSGKTAGMPMRAKSTLQGAPSPAEDLKSVKKALTKYVDSKSCVGTTDSAPALLHGFAQRGMPVVGARHYLDEMTPFRAIKKKGLTKQQERTLKKASTNAKKASLEQKTQYKVVAGDNQAESLISSVKLQLRRSKSSWSGALQNLPM